MHSQPCSLRALPGLHRLDDVVNAGGLNTYGIGKAELRESFQFLTDTHLSAARVYAAVHPRRGRPASAGLVNPLTKRLTCCLAAAPNNKRQVATPSAA